MGALHIGHQLSYVTVERHILGQLQILAGLHKSADQLLEYGANHLTLGSATDAAAKIAGIAALTWYTAKIGVSIFISTLTFMSYMHHHYIYIHTYIYIQRTSILEEVRGNKRGREGGVTTQKH